MANTKSAAKNARKSVRNRDRNREVKDGVKKAEKELRKLVAAKKFDEAKALYPKVVSVFDKAAKGSAVHVNKARRKSSQLSRLIKTAETAVVA